MLAHRDSYFFQKVKRHFSTGTYEDKIVLKPDIAFWRRQHNVMFVNGLNVRIEDDDDLVLCFLLFEVEFIPFFDA